MRFQYLALRIQQAPKGSLGARMQRNLHADTLYKFVDGIEIGENDVTISPTDADILYDFASCDRQISLSINAIVGENGSGKSSIIDYIVRILNNLSAIMLGEEYRTPGAEHLHYIRGVYAELFIKINTTIFQITCNDASTWISSYDKMENSNKYERSDTIHEASISDTDNNVLSSWDGAYDLLSKFCFTIVANFSLYSFNSYCYSEEATEFAKEDKIRRRGQKNHYNIDTLQEIRRKYGKGRVNESCNWLQGLFYKNDGYQVPIVLAPMRDAGRIDMQKEYRLAKERMLSLVFMRDENDKYYFRRINGKLEIDSVSIVKDKYFELNYDDDNSSEYLQNLNEASFRDVAGLIKCSIKDLCDISGENTRAHQELVWNYIIHKIIKIVFVYPRYKIYRTILGSYKNGLNSNVVVEIRNMVSLILRDHSHVTRKLYRSIYYLKYEHIANRKNLHIDSFYEEISKLVQGDEEHPYLPFQTDELLPPPVFHTDFKLYYKDDISRVSPIMFNTLSSGEKQITYTLSTLYYHLANLDSVGNVFDVTIEENKQNRSQADVIQYKYAMIIFDEIELYFHPEMQRTFIAYMLDGLKQLRFRNIDGLQVLFATHSPFILSDIPKSNVLFLGKDGYPQRLDEMCTFGANIHSMLKHSFFLQDGTVGSFVQSILDRTFDTLNFYYLMHEVIAILDEEKEQDRQDRRLKDMYASNYRMVHSLPESYQRVLSHKEFSEYITVEREEMKKVKAVINMVQDKIVKQVLDEQYTQWEEYVAPNN